jgi:hypothetical protein
MFLNPAAKAPSFSKLLNTMTSTTTNPLFVVRFFRWVFSWRIMRRLLISLASVITLIALFRAEENWRGKRAWDKYKAGLAASGKELDWLAMIPKPVPADQNFAATPSLAALFPQGHWGAWSSNYTKATALIAPKGSEKEGQRRFTDLVAWEKAFAAVRSGKTPSGINPGPMEAIPNQRQPDLRIVESSEPDLLLCAKAAPTVLDGLQDLQPVINELRAASQRPSSRYNVTYDLDNPAGILLPHLSAIRGMTKMLQLKISAELAANQTEQAMSDLKLSLRMADSIKEEPFLVSHLVRLACVQEIVQSVWAGLAQQKWTDAQLQEIQSQLQEFKFLSELQVSLDSERAWGILIVDLLARGKYRLSDLVADGDPNGSRITDLIGSSLVPRGWFHFEMVNYGQLHERHVKESFDPAAGRIFLDGIRRNADSFAAEVQGSSPVRTIFEHRVIASTLLPAVAKVPEKAATGQIAVDQAVLACALERYRLAHGQLPDALTALVPRFVGQIPHDLMTGEPYKYRRTHDGRFILYAVGRDGKDDGGTAGTKLFDDTGDWVWSYPSERSPGSGAN